MSGFGAESVRWSLLRQRLRRAGGVQGSGSGRRAVASRHAHPPSLRDAHLDDSVKDIPVPSMFSNRCHATHQSTDFMIGAARLPEPESRSPGLFSQQFGDKCISLLVQTAYSITRPETWAVHQCAVGFLAAEAEHSTLLGKLWATGSRFATCPSSIFATTETEHRLPSEAFGEGGTTEHFPPPTPEPRPPRPRPRRYGGARVPATAKTSFRRSTSEGGQSGGSVSASQASM